MANLFAFALAENRLVYQPGETISGSLLLNTDKELNLRSIRVELQGTGHVRIRSGKVTYERREPYLGFQIVVLGRGENLTRKLLCDQSIAFNHRPQRVWQQRVYCHAIKEVETTLTIKLQRPNPNEEEVGG